MIDFSSYFSTLGGPRGGSKMKKKLAFVPKGIPIHPERVTSPPPKKKKNSFLSTLIRDVLFLLSHKSRQWNFGWQEANKNESDIY